MLFEVMFSFASESSISNSRKKSFELLQRNIISRADSILRDIKTQGVTTCVCHNQPAQSKIYICLISGHLNRVQQLAATLQGSRSHGHRLQPLHGSGSATKCGRFLSFTPRILCRWNLLSPSHGCGRGTFRCAAETHWYADTVPIGRNSIVGEMTRSREGDVSILPVL